MKKILKMFVLLFIVTCYYTGTIYALPNSLGKLTRPELEADWYKKIDGFGTTFKYSDAEGAIGAVLCTKHQDKSPSGNDTVCEINNDWDVRVRAGIAAIITTASVPNDKVSEKYFYAVYTINQFLYDKGVGGQNVANDFPSLATNQYYLDFMKAANDAYNEAVEPTITISESSLTFTLKDDKYVSQAINVSSNVTKENIQVSVVGGDLIDNKDGSYAVSINSDKVEVGKETDVVFKVTAAKTVKQARNYSCGTYVDETDYDDDGNKTEVLAYQTVTPSNYENKDLISEKTINGKINKSTSVTIRKVDEDNKLLPGVVLKVESEENNYSETFTTTSEETKIENLKFGKYKVTEISTPDGYVKLTKPVEFTISENNLNEEITLSNSLTRVEISKISSVDSKLLAGAVLQLQDEEGNVVKNKEGKKYEWTSTDEVYVISGLPLGTYYLVEISAPEGYELNKNKKEFKVDGETKVIKVEMENNIEVKVPDTLSARSALLITISMFDIFLGIGILTYVKKNKAQE